MRIGRRLVPSHVIQQRMDRVDLRFQREARAAELLRINRALDVCGVCSGPLDPAGWCVTDSCAGAYPKDQP